MPRSRVPVRGSIGKSIRTGVSTTTITNPVQIITRTQNVGGAGNVGSTIWPLVGQIPTPVLDLAALSTVGIVAFTGTDIVSRLLTTSDIPTLPPSKISGLATVATTGLLEDLGDVKVVSRADGDTILWVAVDNKWENFPGGMGGTVTRVGLADISTTPIYAVSGSPIGTLGTLQIQLLTQLANKVFAGPASGGVLAPTFRSLVTADIPTLPTAKISGLATVATTGLASDISGLAAIATSGSASDLATGTVPSLRLPLASSSVFGAVKVDNTTITASSGVISATGGGGGGNVTPDTHPTSPSGQNDEFESGSTINTGLWTAFGLSTGTTTVGQGSLGFLAALTASRNWGGYTQAVPGGTWAYTAKVGLFSASTNTLFGIFVATASGAAGKVVLFALNQGNLIVQRLTNNTTFSANQLLGTAPTNGGAGALAINWYYLRITYDGTNLKFAISVSGVEGTFTQVYTETTAAFLGTPTLIGVGADNESATVQSVGICDWFRKTA